MIGSVSARPCPGCQRQDQLEEKRKKASSEYANALAALHSGDAKAAQGAFDKLKKDVEPSDPLRSAVQQLGVAVQERQDCLAHRRQLAAYAKVQASLHKVNSTVESRA